MVITAIVDSKVQRVVVGIVARLSVTGCSIWTVFSGYQLSDGTAVGSHPEITTLGDCFLTCLRDSNCLSFDWDADKLNDNTYCWTSGQLTEDLTKVSWHSITHYNLINRTTTDQCSS